MSTANDISDRDRIDAEACDWFARRADRQGGLHAVAADDEEERQFQAWLDQDPRHKAAYAFVARTADDITWTFPADTALRAPDTKPAWMKMAVAAAAVVVLIGGAGLGLTPLIRSLTEVTHRTGVGETKQLTLADGTTVNLLGKSEISVHYTARQRQVTLVYGEAYFQVAHNAKVPFSVVAGDTTVRDVGTQFDVNMRRNSTEVSVVEGAVQLTRAAAANTTATPLVLNAIGGQRVKLPNIKTSGTTGNPVAAIALPEVEPLAAQDAVAVREGRQVYNDTALGDIIEDINRYYGPGVKLADPSLATRRLTVTFMPKDIDSFLSLLPVAAGVKVERQGDGSVVISAQNAAPVGNS